MKRTLVLASALLLASCSPTVHNNVSQTLQNLNEDLKVVAPTAKAVICLDAAGAIISGKILTDTGNAAGTAVSSGGAAIAALCPTGTTPAQ